MQYFFYINDIEDRHNGVVSICRSANQNTAVQGLIGSTNAYIGLSDTATEVDLPGYECDMEIIMVMIGSNNAYIGFSDTALGELSLNQHFFVVEAFLRKKLHFFNQ